MTVPNDPASNLLKGKVVVTGASNGIGRTIEIRAAVHGAEAVVAAGIRESPREGGDPTSKTIQHLGVTTRFAATGIPQPSHIDRLVGIAEPLGGVDVMVCDAEVLRSHDDADIGEYDSHRLMAADVAGRPPHRSGRSPANGVIGADARISQCTAEGAVTSMARAPADAFGPSGIRVNAVSPSTIDRTLLRSRHGTTASAERLARRTPLRRLGAPSEVADAVACLGSDLSSHVTDTVLIVAGGLAAGT